MFLERNSKILVKLARNRWTRKFAKSFYAFTHGIVTNLYIRDLPTKIRLIAGDEEFTSNKEKVILCCVVKNGAEHMTAFLDYYLNVLKVHHIVLMDNQSDDLTVEIAGKYDRVTIYQTDLNFGIYKNIIRRYMAEKFAKGGWVLSVDIDEFFDFPNSDQVTIHSLIRYLNKNSYNAITGYLLDMIPNDRIFFSANREREFHRHDHTLYDISDIQQWGYPDKLRLINNVINNQEIQPRSGGIRKTLFNIKPNLLKYPLVRPDGKIKLFYGSHGIGNANIADISSVLFHYKFTSNFIEKAKHAVQEGNYHNRSIEYQAYIKKFKETKPNQLSIDKLQAQKITSTNDLIDNNFLHDSENYREWVRVEAMKEKGIK